MTASRDRLVQLLTPAVQATGHDLEDVTVSPAGKRRVVRVYVERSELDGQGITLDDVASVSRAVSDVLDAAEEAEPELLGGAYVLEVSSPGVDRPLTTAKHFARNTGRLVTVTLTDGSAVTGRITSADQAEVRLDLDGTERVLALGEVGQALVQVEFNRPGQPETDEPDDTDDTDDSDETDEEDDA